MSRISLFTVGTAEFGRDRGSNPSSARAAPPPLGPALTDSSLPQCFSLHGASSVSPLSEYHGHAAPCYNQPCENRPFIDVREARVKED
jgi:hypothetical protein